MKIKTILFTVIALTVFVAACSFTTAKLGELKFGKNDKANPPATTFDAGEKFFAVTETTGAMGKHKVKFKLTYEDVAGKKKGDEVLAKEIEVEGNASPFLSLTVPDGGTYKLDVTMSDESGKQIDAKSGTFTIKGAPAPKPDTSAKPDDDSGKDEDDEKK